MLIEDEAKASEYLQRIGYYRLSAYWHPMRKRCAATGQVQDDFSEGTTFKEVTDLYLFDGRLRLIMLDALERLEVSLRTEVALTLGRKHPKAHRKPEYLGANFSKATTKNGPTRHRKWLQKLDDRFLNSKDQFAEHFRKKYPSDDMPVWIAVELLDFGPLSHLIAGMSFADKKAIGASYGNLDPQLISSWARSLSYVRNVCAHHSRLWNKPLVNQPSLKRRLAPEALHHVIDARSGATRFYAIACIARFMLSFANPRTSWHERLIAHVATFPDSPRVSLSAAGFPKDWSEQPLWTETPLPA
ncbi:abi family protein [Aquicoccus sp. SCR17]|nr:abi family protein [Carideicomes alvinocaridis]